MLVAGSHGGVIAAYLGARAGAHALILNDAGLGKDRAGIAGLFYLEAIGMAAAAVDCHSARIGDGADMLARGVISHANAFAALCGVVAGQACRDAAERLRRAAPPKAEPPGCGEGRWQLARGAREVWALDSIGKLLPEDAGRILVLGSHGALHGGRRESALAVDAAAAVFNDAGVGADRIGISRLPALGRARHSRGRGRLHERAHRRRALDVGKRRDPARERAGGRAGRHARHERARVRGGDRRRYIRAMSSPKASTFPQSVNSTTALGSVGPPVSHMMKRMIMRSTVP